mgnify:CR=1 FL=1
MKDSKKKMNLASLDSIFTTQEERDEFLKLPTEDEILEDKKNGLRQMKLLKLIPDEVTYEEWEKASYPIGWRNQENKNEV